MLSGGIVVGGVATRYIQRSQGNTFPWNFHIHMLSEFQGKVFPVALERVAMDDDRAWHHVVLTTYGAWLPGDPRGFRTLHHREHVEGDYRDPPPSGVYEGLARHSRESLSQPPVVLPVELRSIVGNELRNRLALLHGWVLCCAVAKQHVHLLVKLRAHEARNHLGSPRNTSRSPFASMAGPATCGRPKARSTAFARASIKSPRIATSSGTRMRVRGSVFGRRILRLNAYHYFAAGIGNQSP